MKALTIAHVTVAALVGVLYGWVAANFWGFYSTNNPIAGWLIASLAERGHSVLFQVSVSVHDIVVNVILATPFAAILVALRPLNRWPLVLISALAGFVVINWGVEWSWRLAQASMFWLGLAMALFSLPLAFAGVRAFRHVLGDEGRATAA